MDLQVQIRSDLPANDDRLTSRLATMFPAMLRVSPIALFLLPFPYALSYSFHQ